MLIQPIEKKETLKEIKNRLFSMQLDMLNVTHVSSLVLRFVISALTFIPLAAILLDKDAYKLEYADKSISHFYHSFIVFDTIKIQE